MTNSNNNLKRNKNNNNDCSQPIEWGLMCTIMAQQQKAMYTAFTHRR